MSVVITKEMGFSHRQLLRVMSQAARGRPCRLGDAEVIIEDGDGRSVRVTLEPEQERRIASISLPLTVVHFEFSGFDESEANAELDRMSIHFHKGGG